VSWFANAPLPGVALQSQSAGRNNERSERFCSHRGSTKGSTMRRLADLIRLIFGLRKRHPVDDDPNLPFTSEEFARLIRSGQREDMKRLANSLACRKTLDGAEH